MSDLQTVTFKARNTNSAPPPVPVRRNTLPRVLSLVASCAVAYGLIFYLPPEPESVRVWPSQQPIAKLEAQYRKADDLCERGWDHHCWIRQDLQHRIYDARRAGSYTVHGNNAVVARWVIYGFVVLVLWSVHDIGAPAPTLLTQLPTLPPKPPEDPEAEKAKRAGLDNWLAFDGVTRHDTPQPSVKLRDAFTKYEKWAKAQINMPIYDIDGFQRALRAITGRDTVNVGGTILLPGLSFANTSLI